MTCKGTGATSYGACEIAGYCVPNGAKDPTDNPDIFAEDILNAGMGMANPDLVDILAKNAQNSFIDLENWGLHFERDNDTYLVMKGCYSSKPRGHIIKGHGEPVMKVLMNEINKRNITIWENTAIISLLAKDETCAGAVAVNSRNEALHICSKAVVLATGGASQVFMKNLNPKDVSGDGYRLAHQAGAKLVNMEFMQAGIGFSYPIESLFNTYLWTGFPDIRNANGKLFLGKNLPEGFIDKDIMKEHCKHFPFSSRDISRFVEIGIQREIAEGRGTIRGGVPVSFAHFTPSYIDSIQDGYNLRELFPMVLEHFRSQGVDLLRDQVEISCYAQAINGGVAIDANAMSTLPGLFAAGETAGGPHGADRLGGNMFVTCQVFGKIAGSNAARFAMKNDHRLMNKAVIQEQSADILALAQKECDINLLDKQLKLSTQNNLLIRRNEKGLKNLLSDLEKISNCLKFSPEGKNINMENISLAGKIIAAQLMTQAALVRKESRGSHYREDYPETDEQYGKVQYL